MSAFEPQLPTDPKVDMPDFMVVLRGFDRRQVEMWAAEVANQIEQERLRADEAERTLYRMQIEHKGAPSFSHLGTHVASILEEAGRSSENMLADAADRAQETIEAAEEEAAAIIKAAEHRVGEIEQEARRTLEDSRAEGARVEEDALQGAEEMRAQAEQDARTVLEEARDATDMIWQEAERERVTVEAETIRLETLRHRSVEQLGRVYGHLESVLAEVRAGIGRVEEEEDEAAAAAAAAARLGVEPPASSLEDSPRFPSTSESQATRPGEGPAEGGDDLLATSRPDTTATGPATATETAGSAGEESGEEGQPMQPDDGAGSPVTGEVEPASADGSSETTTQQVAVGDASEAAQPVPPSEATRQAANGEGLTHDPDATQRLEPVGGKIRQPKPATRDAKDRP